MEAVTPTAGAAVSKQFWELGVSDKPTSKHVNPAGKYEKPGPLVTDDVLKLVVEMVVLEVEETVLVYASRHMYRQSEFGCVTDPFDKEKKQC